MGTHPIFESDFDCLTDMMWWLILAVVATRASVIELGANLEAVVASKQPLLVQFYAPWCGHCQQMAPTWSALGSSPRLKGVMVGKLDCTAHQAVAQKFGIRGFPTVKFFRNGRGIDYDGARTEEKIAAFAHAMLQPAVKTQLDTSLASLIASKPEPPVFLHLGQRGELYGEFEHVAELFMPQLGFYHIEAPHAGRIGVVKDGQMFDYVPGSAARQLAAWVSAEKESSFGEFTLKTAKRFVKHKFIVVAIDKVDGSEATKTVEQMALSRSPALAEFHFTHGYTDMAQRSLDHLTYRDANEGDIIILPKDAHDGYYYLTHGPISEQNLQIFLDQVKKGEAELLGKSAFSRFVWDFIAGFMRLFKENPVLGGLIVGIPSLLIGFIIFGICSIPEGEYEDFSDSDQDGDEDHEDDGDISSEHDDDDQSSIRQRRSQQHEQQTQTSPAVDEHSNTASTETSKDK